MLASLLEKLEAVRPFTEEQAWGLFRIIAFSEAIGWTILIAGIVIHRYNWPGHSAALLVAGQIHGTTFLVYFGVLATIYSSLRWPRRRFLVAVLAGVPPYGTLVFEQWAAHQRHRSFRRHHFGSIALVILSAQL